MSVKFKETIQQTVNQAGVNGVTGNMAGMAQQASDGLARFAGDGKHHGFAHEAGEFLTQGGGAKGYLQVCWTQNSPLWLDDILTAPTVLHSGTGEEPASHQDVDLRHPRRTAGAARQLDCKGPLQARPLLQLQNPQNGDLRRFRQRADGTLPDQVPSVAVQGQDVGQEQDCHDCHQQSLRRPTRTTGRTGPIRLTLDQISPLQNTIYLFSMAIIAGARTLHQIRATIRAGFWPVMRVSWISSPIALAFAQAFLPQEMWVPFFNLLAFVVGTYINTITKKKRLAALRRKYAESRGEREEFYERTERIERRD